MSVSYYDRLNGPNDYLGIGLHIPAKDPYNIGICPGPFSRKAPYDFMRTTEKMGSELKDYWYNRWQGQP